MGRATNLPLAAPFLTWPLDGSDVASLPTTPIPDTALKHSYVDHTAFGLQITDTPVAKTVHLFTGSGVGAITSVNASVTVPGSSASVTIDVKKNGTTILSSVITLTNASAARTKVAGTVSIPSYVDGDEFTAVLAVSASTGMQGVKVIVSRVENGTPL